LGFGFILSHVADDLGRRETLKPNASAYDQRSRGSCLGNRFHIARWVWSVRERASFNATDCREAGRNCYF